jgi:hypothetical protein
MTATFTGDVPARSPSCMPIIEGACSPLPVPEVAVSSGIARVTLAMGLIAAWGAERALEIWGHMYPLTSDLGGFPDGVDQVIDVWDERLGRTLSSEERIVVDKCKGHRRLGRLESGSYSGWSHLRSDGSQYAIDRRLFWRGDTLTNACMKRIAVRVLADREAQEAQERARIEMLRAPLEGIAAAAGLALFLDRLRIEGAKEGSVTIMHHGKNTAQWACSTWGRGRKTTIKPRRGWLIWTSEGVQYGECR